MAGCCNQFTMQHQQRHYNHIANFKKTNESDIMKKSALEKRPCVYILRCSDGTLYTGWTNDMTKRLKSHNSGQGAKYTRSRLPAVPVYIEYQSSRSQALKREAAIKKLTRAGKLKLIESDSNQLSNFISPLQSV